MNNPFDTINSEETESLILNSFTAYQKAVDAAAIVSITDALGKIIFANDMFCEISQYSRQELIGRDHRIVNSGMHSKDFFKNLWEEIACGKIWHGEIKNKAKDGSYYWVDTTISPIFNDEGRIVQYLSIRTLITERKTLEQEKEALLTSLTEKYNDLMQFSFIVSHNLRNPISNIIGLANLLHDECPNCDDETKELLKHIEGSAINMLETIHDLNSILMVSKGVGRKIETLNFPEIIAAVQKNLEREILESGTTIEIIINECDYYYQSVKSYLHSIFFNLIANAIKYRKGNANPVVTIDIKRSGDLFLIKISDNGIGMNLTKIGNDLFGLYKRFNTDREGKGLGLHMVKAQVEALKGKIDVASVPGEGTTFLISLPA
jgi:PAS domain S-box-containing protein